jgi:hypothetical protein
MVLLSTLELLSGSADIKAGGRSAQNTAGRKDRKNIQERQVGGKQAEDASRG